MKVKDFTITTQLIISFAIILFFVFVIGIVAYSQTAKLHQQTETMYNHPLQVRIAFGYLNADVLKMRLAVEDLFIANTDQGKQNAAQGIVLAGLDADKQFEVIQSKYLGPAEDVDASYNSYVIWKKECENALAQVLDGNVEAARSRLLPGGSESVLREQMMDNIKKIDEFSLQKGEELYNNSNKEKDALNNQLIVLLVIIILLILGIVFYLVTYTRGPLREMNKAVLRFHRGDMTARIDYESKNELGVLADSINTMADSIVGNIEMRDRSVDFIEEMLKEEEAGEFFKITLNALARYTNAQIAAVYLLSEDKKTFRHFKSIGMDGNVKESFSANSLEGEFGTTILNGKPQMITNIPEDTRFRFNTASGSFMPREIITLPIISGSEKIAVISLASISRFEPKAMEFINSISFTLNARIQGVLASRRISEIMGELEKHNMELNANKIELSAQASELIQQNTELEMQKKQLGEANQLKTNFLSNMSHELRTPLNSVIALAGVLSRRLIHQIPEEEFNYLEIIERNGRNLLLLINDILDISRIEAGREEIDVVQFRLDNLIGEVIAMLEPQTNEKDIELVFHKEKEQTLLSSDMNKCRHILQNIIGNAVKFTEQGKVSVSVMNTGEEILITVSDTGIGISAEALPHIFDEFRQADGSTSRRFGGTGLGLAIAKKYANLLGGSITVESTSGVGSEFILSLPVTYDGEKAVLEEKPWTPTAAVIKSVSTDHSGRWNKKILIVDDNESAVIQIKELVGDLGFATLIARDAMEAFDLIDKTIPDAIILDLMMPDIDGFNVLQTIRNAESTAHIPVLILSAKHITKDELKELKRNNIHQLIQKGDVDRAKLETAISTMLYPEEVILEKCNGKKQIIEGKPFVLVVEDNPDNMISIKALLSQEFIVEEAVTGEMALEMVKVHIPNLILMDIALPGTNGIETFYEIRKHPQLINTPVIALTASAMDTERESILAHGFDAFIPKPIIAEEFFKVIGEVLYGK